MTLLLETVWPSHPPSITGSTAKTLMESDKSKCAAQQSKVGNQASYKKLPLLPLHPQPMHRPPHRTPALASMHHKSKHFLILAQQTDDQPPTVQLEQPEPEDIAVIHRRMILASRPLRYCWPKECNTQRLAPLKIERVQNTRRTGDVDLGLLESASSDSEALLDSQNPVDPVCSAFLFETEPSI